MNKLPLLLAVCASLFASALCAQTPATVPASADAPTYTRPGPKVGDLAPDFTVIDAAG